MRAFIYCLLMLLPATLLVRAAAAETTGPDAFASELVLTMQYSADPDDAELLDMWCSHINETDGALLANPDCYAPLLWEWPAFYADADYSATDEYGDWDVTVYLDGVMNLDKLVTIDGVDYPYIDTMTVEYAIDWTGKDGSSFSTAWSYTLNDIPPVAKPASDVFLQGLTDGLPSDRLTYSLALTGKAQVEQHLADFSYYTNTADPAFPDSDYEFETDGAPAKELHFDMIMYYAAGEG